MVSDNGKTRSDAQPVDLETMAAIAEGRVQEPELSELLEQVVDSPADTEVLAETIEMVREERERSQAQLLEQRDRFSSQREDEAPSPDGGEAARQKSERFSILPILLAAALAIALVAAFLWRSSTATPTAQDLSAELRLGNELGNAVEEVWLKPVWSVNRSGGSPPESSTLFSDLEVEQQAFRLGASHLDLAVALRRGDEVSWQTSASFARQLADEVGRLEWMLDRYDELGEEKIADGVSEEKVEKISEALQEMEATVRESLEAQGKDLELHFDTGRFAQAARIASIAEDHRALQQGAFLESEASLSSALERAEIDAELESALEVLLRLIRELKEPAISLSDVTTAAERVLADWGGRGYLPEAEDSPGPTASIDRRG
ncbi:MAG: hypothetical protein AAGD01_01275 [Acidobacteriota bacterium]